MSSSGLVFPPGASVRATQVTGRSESAPLAPLKVPDPDIRSPFHLAVACRSIPGMSILLTRPDGPFRIANATRRSEQPAKGRMRLRRGAMTVEFSVVIPARYASARLPGKPLADIAGRPMIAWVCDQARRSGATEVIVATDDARIVSACEAAEVQVELTGAHHASGTDRIAELAHRFGWSDDRI